MIHARQASRRRDHRGAFLSIALGALALSGIPAAALQPSDTDQTRSASRADESRALPSIEDAIQRLASRIDQLDAMRARLSELKQGLESGGSLDDLLDAEDRWLLGRGGFGIGSGQPPGMTPGDADRMPGRPMGRPSDDLLRGQRPPRDPSGQPPDDAADKRDGRGGPPDRGEPLSDDELAQIRGLIEEHVPSIAARLRVAEESDPESAERFLRRVAPRFRDLLELQREAPELVEVRVAELKTGMEIVGAARSLRRLAESDPEAFEEKKLAVRALLVRQLTLRDQLEEHRLNMLAADVDAARERLRARAADRDSVIDQHLERVIDRALGRVSERTPDRAGRVDGRERRGSRSDRPEGGDRRPVPDAPRD